MRTIFKIFIRDLKRIRKNVIAIIVMVGIIIVPACYAWFNIAANWDPYGNTEGLTVAVANADAGYDSNIVQLNLNLGEQIVHSLKENDQIGWKFTSVKNAKNGVKSGKYYAAIVIPEDFSQKLLSVFTKDANNAKLEYYINEKENAIAPKITDKGADAVQQQINETFTQTVAKAASGALEILTENLDGETSEEFLSKLTDSLDTAAGDLETLQSTVTAFSHMAGTLDSLLVSAQTTLPTIGQVSEEGKAALENASFLDSAQASMELVSDTLSSVAEQSGHFSDSVLTAVNTALDTIDSDSSLAAEHFSDISEDIQADTEKLAEYQTALRQLKVELEALPLPPDTSLIDSMIAKLQQAIDRENSLSQRLTDLSTSVLDGAEISSQTRKDLQALIQNTNSDLSDVKEDYHNTIQPQLDELSTSIQTASDNLSSILNRTGENFTQLSNLLVNADSSLSDAQAALEQTGSLLSHTQEQIENTLTKLQRAQNENPDSTVSELLKTSPSTMGTFLASPVQLDTHRLYPIENYGSAMACFYSSLAFWVGGVVMVALLKVEVDEDETLKNLKPFQKYLGRYLIFLLAGLLQATIICMGDLWFLEIQCLHPFYFLLAGWISSFVYVNIIYTLTVSFGDIGKAICVILLVIQIAASGGLFPIEVEPAFFQNVYPALPFTYSVNALRECVAGIYQNSYWLDLGKLMIYYLLALALGLIFRRPLIKAMAKFNQKLESTQVM